MAPTCNICDQNCSELFQAQVLSKYIVNYYRCDNCGFIQTEDPHWLDEAYASAITALDIGLVRRNIKQSRRIYWIIDDCFDRNRQFIDYGGGYGLFVRLMRDRGLNYYRQDDYCANLFADYFDVEDQSSVTDYELLTALEVFEHLPKPIEQFSRMRNYSSNILFSTELVPDNSISAVDDWWYFTPQTGQHVALYTEKSLRILAGKFDCNFYSNGSNLHLISTKKFDRNPLQDTLTRKLKRSLLSGKQSGSLQKADYQYIAGKLGN